MMIHIGVELQKDGTLFNTLGLVDVGKGWEVMVLLEVKEMEGEVMELAVKVRKASVSLRM